MTFGSSWGVAVVLGAVVWGLPGGAGSLHGQTSAAPVQTSGAAAPPAGSSSAAVPAKKDARKAKTQHNTSGNPQLRRIPIEGEPSTTGGLGETSAQRAADQKLLQQQQAQSAQAAQITDQQVNKAQGRIDKIQNEQRIQDAPGPSQTGVVPVAGPPVQPGSAGGGGTIQDAPTIPASADIQDAPGPSQTLSPGPSVPAQSGPSVPPQTGPSVPAQSGPSVPAQPPQPPAEKPRG